MVQPQPDSGGGRDSGADRISRFIRDHIARGNKPDYELAQRKLAEFHQAVSKLEPSGLSEDEIEELVTKHCGRRNILEDWPVVPLDEWEHGRR